MSETLLVNPYSCLVQAWVDSESRFAIFLARILWKLKLASRENISTSLASLTSRARGENAIHCEACESRNCDSRNLRDLQTSKIIVHSKKLVLDPKFAQDICKTSELKFVLILKSCYEICLRLVRSESCYKISFCETRKKRVSLLHFCL